MKHLTLFFAFGALLFLSCQTVSARGVKIPFGDREVLNKVADLPDTEEYKTDNGNYIDLSGITGQTRGEKISSAHHRQRTDRHERPPQQDPIPVYAERGGCNGSAGRTITSYG